MSEKKNLPKDEILAFYADYLLFDAYLLKIGFTTRHKRSFDFEEFGDSELPDSYGYFPYSANDKFKTFYEYYAKLFKSFQADLCNRTFVIPMELCWANLISFSPQSFEKMDPEGVPLCFNTINHTSRNFIENIRLTFTGTLPKLHHNYLRGELNYQDYRIVNNLIYASFDTSFDNFKNAYSEISEALSNPLLPSRCPRAQKSLIGAGGKVPVWLHYFLTITFQELLVDHGFSFGPQETKNYLFQKLLEVSEFWNVHQITALPEAPASIEGTESTIE
jgi:hypothetical protein